MNKTNLKQYSNPNVDSSEEVACHLEACAAKVRSGEIDYTMIMLIIHRRDWAPSADFLGQRPAILTTIGALEAVKVDLIDTMRGGV